MRPTYPSQDRELEIRVVYNFNGFLVRQRAAERLRLKLLGCAVDTDAIE